MKPGQPYFVEVDNPGDWSEYTYQAKFKKAGKDKGQYLHHSLPTGATPVPVDDNGIRKIEDWHFNYDGWQNEGPMYQSGATRDNMFPECRKGSLDKEILNSLGLTPQRMVADPEGNPDALFFYQLLFPICDTKCSGVFSDPRKRYYPHVSRCTNLYAFGELELGNGYGHNYKSTEPAELLRWDGVTLMDGVRGGSQGAILR